MRLVLGKRQSDQIRKRLERLYGAEEANRGVRRFQMMLGRYGVGLQHPPPPKLWDENDVVLITYADSLRRGEEVPLKVLRRFLGERLKGAIRIVHLLPFYPWTSDDGFSVVDYREVERDNGTWLDVERLGEDFSLMFDLVLNHCSRQSRWFREFVMGVDPGRNYFITESPKTDLSAVVRPRPWPLLTRTAKRDGEVYVWTTFSEDQVDLNWKDPNVLFEFLDILFLYVSKGVRILRLDAVAFLWKEIGTNCLHRPETHEVVKLIRDVLEVVAPEVIVLTETNVPHEENISYFGEGNEAHMVYNFSLPPLLLHGLLRGDSTHLREWAETLPDLSAGQTFLNFTASHDGIGVRPLQGILDARELKWVVKEVKARGGRVSMRAMPDGSEQPYEMNITYLDALAVPGNDDLSMARFLCSQALMLALRGMPAVYIHSLLGTPNDVAGVKATGENRSINRRKWDVDHLERELEREDGRQHAIHMQYTSWLQRRQNHPAFHPEAPMEILNLGTSLFGFVRTARDESEVIACVFNFTGLEQDVSLAALHLRLAGKGTCREILSGTRVGTGPGASFRLPPYHGAWFGVGENPAS